MKRGSDTMESTHFPYRLLLIGSDLLVVQAAQCFVSQGFSVCVMLPENEVDAGIFDAVQSLGIPVYWFESIGSDAAFKTAQSLHVHYMATLVFDERIPERFCALASIAALNIHPSPLPEVRTGNAWFWPVRLGLKESAICVHRLTPEWDAGDIVYTHSFEMGPHDTQGVYYERVQRALGPCCAELARLLATGTVTGRPQGVGRYYPKLRVKDILVDWTETSASIDALVRACNPYHFAETRFRRLHLYVIDVTPVGTQDSVWDVLASQNPRCGTMVVCSHLPFCKTSDGWVRLDVLGVPDRMVMSGRRFVSMFGVKTGDEMLSLTSDPQWALMLEKKL